MKVVLITAIILIPLLMFYGRSRWDTVKRILNLAAILSLVIIGIISSFSIYKIIQENTVFMTTIHAVFLNPYFLFTGGYLGVYSLYLLISWSWKDW